MIEMLSLPDAEETERFIEQKAAEGIAVAELTIKELHEEIAEYKKTIALVDKDLILKLCYVAEFKSAKKFMRVAERFSEKVIDYRFSSTQMIHAMRREIFKCRDVARFKSLTDDSASEKCLCVHLDFL